MLTSFPVMMKGFLNPSLDFRMFSGNDMGVVGPMIRGLLGPSSDFCMFSGSDEWIFPPHLILIFSGSDGGIFFFFKFFLHIFRQ